MNILFVCTVNTCRSVIAESILDKMKLENNIIVNSVGISIVPGSTVTEKAASIILNNLDKDVAGREAIEIKESDLDEADLVLTMTDYSKEFVVEKFPKYKEKIYSICEYAGIDGEITDPYGSSISVYEKTYSELSGIVPVILDKIKKEGSI